MSSAVAPKDQTASGMFTPPPDPTNDSLGDHSAFGAVQGVEGEDFSEVDSLGCLKSEYIRGELMFAVVYVFLLVVDHCYNWGSSSPIPWDHRLWRCTTYTHVSLAIMSALCSSCCPDRVMKKTHDRCTRICKIRPTDHNNEVFRCGCCRIRPSNQEYYLFAIVMWALNFGVSVSGFVYALSTLIQKMQ